MHTTYIIDFDQLYMVIKNFIPFMHFNFVFVLIFLIFFETESVASLGDHANGLFVKCHEKEKQALLEFKAGVVDFSGHISTWRARSDCCNWSGIQCGDQTGHVTKIDLQHFEVLLKDEISPSLGNLSYLTYLDLRGKNVGQIHIPKQPVPNFIASLTKLRYLDLSYNTFDGKVPNFIGSLTKLRYLNLSYNSLDGTIPKSIGSLTELRYLDLSSNHFHGILPSELGYLTNLRYLKLARSGSVKNLDWLSHISVLQHLDLEGTPFIEPNHWVDMILRLPKLSDLSLGNCNLSKATLNPSSSFLNSSSSIANLDLSNNNLTSSAYSWLLPLTSYRLHHLDLSSNRLDGFPNYFGSLCSLKSLVIKLNLAETSFQDLLTSLSGCAASSLEEMDLIVSRFTGSVPSGIRKFVALKKLMLSYNQLNGTISETLWELPNLEHFRVSFNSLKGIIPKEFGNSKLRYIDLSSNSFDGVLSEIHMQNLSNLEHLDLSLNSFSLELSPKWVPPFQLDFIDLSNCKVGPQFPTWIQTQRNLTYLNLANSSISDIVSMGFWDSWHSRVIYLNLSFNDITGELPDLSSRIGLYSAIDLSSNNFYGSIPNFPSNLVSLNLSKNKFSGGISFLCQIADGLLSFLDLSKNLLTGNVPDCLSHFKELIILNLGHNNLSGPIPVSVGSLIQLEVLHLCNNSFSGELPSLMKNCTRLNFLCLGANRFSGILPAWIAENLSGLYALSLGANEFVGTIPSQLCQLENLQILDLSKNKLSGTIPSCLNNLTAITQKGSSLEQTLHYFLPGYTSIGLDGPRVYDYSNYIDYAMIQWQGNELEFRNVNLGLLKSIDLSSNNLVGEIPDELTDLHDLVALNLSMNALNGKIPQKTGDLKSLQVLDLSRNNLSGSIPSSMASMTFLSYLDLSDNELYGRIPNGYQLQSFDASRYTGNAGLCGPPVTRNCPGDETPEVQNRGFEDSNAKEDNSTDGWFYFGAATGFGTGFWVVCGVLLVNRRGRHCFFRFHDSIMEWIYMNMMLICVKFQRTAAAHA